MLRIRMTLLENSYDFLNESLRNATIAEKRPHAWKFAVLHIVQAIELLLKARLQAEHPVLVYENIDRPAGTVSLALAVQRITSSARIHLTPREERSIRRAQKWRDLIVHFEFDFSDYEVQSVYVQLFEFITSFHDNHTSFGAIYDKIEPDLRKKQAELMEFFRREIVMWNGVEVSKAWPKEIVQAQEETGIELHDVLYECIPYGEEPGWWSEPPGHACHDCAVVAGQYHVMSCDMERCPRCYGQLISCGCLWGEGPPDSDLLTADEYARMIVEESREA